jgi:hypothetical protein
VAVGDVNDRGNTSSTLVESWDGTSWSQLPSPSGSRYNYLNDVSCSSATACTAVGYDRNNTREATLVESWDGTSWSIVHAPGTGDTLNGVSCVTASGCMADGRRYTSTEAAKTLIERGQ